MASSFSLQVALLLVLLALAVAAALTDLRSYRIPNQISLAIAAGFPIFALAGGADWRGGLLAGGIVFLIGVFLYSRNWMGGGDVKLLAAVSLWAGTDLVLPMFLIVTVTGGIMSLAEWVRTGGFNRFLARHIPVMDDALVMAVTRERAVVPYAAAILAGVLYVALSRSILLLSTLETI